uniref:Poly [ADP-ribose] polymerase n=1 Tax=Noctiluca scintillans TaxID=2966 RepID=A0A7S0ZVN4_NOCSC
MQARIQALMDATFVRTWTRDRKLRAREETVPSRLLVQSVEKIDNPERFGCYSKRRDEFSSSRAVPSEYEIVSVISAAYFKELAGVDPCVSEAFLFHGTSRDSTVKIATRNLRLDHARSDGLFGKAGYFAEHSSKADEYSKQDGSGVYTMMICRVVLGATLVTDEHHNDARRMRELHGALDRGDCQSIMGVRRKTGYREFAIRDFELVYPEFIVRYHKQWTHMDD